MIVNAFLICLACLCLCGCGGGGSSAGGTSTPTGNVLVDQQNNLPKPFVSAGTIVLPIPGNRVLINIVKSDKMKGLSFILYDMTTQNVTSVFTLEIPNATLLSELGTVNIRPELIDLVVTSDGGVVGQFDVFPENGGSTLGSGVFRLTNNFALSWSKIIGGEEAYGRLQSLVDGYICTGSTITKYNLDGSIAYSKKGTIQDPFAFSASTVSGDTLVGSLRKYLLLDTSGNIKKQFSAGTTSFYYGFRDSDNNIVLTGLSDEFHPFVYKTDTGGNPLLGIQLDLAGDFREIIEVQNNYYAIGSNLICKFNKTLDNVSCKRWPDNLVSFISAHHYIRADQNNNIHISHVIANQYELVIDTNLNVIKPAGLGLTNLNVAILPWATNFVAGITTTLDTPQKLPVNAGMTLTITPLNDVDLTNLN